MENFNFLGFDENYPHFSWMEYGWGILILWDFMKTWDFLDILGLFWGSKVQEILVIGEWRMLGYGFVQPVNIVPMLG